MIPVQKQDSMVANVVSLLHNRKLNTWHPIFFNQHPMPGGTDFSRYKSVGHHTQGFKSRKEALDDIQHKLAPKLICHAICTEKDIEWSGEDIPAMVVFFRDGKLIML